MRRRLRLLVRPRLGPLLPWLAGAGALAAAIVLALVLLGPVSWLIAGSTVRGIPDLKDRAAAISTVRGSVLTASAGIVALVALYFTGRNYYLSRRGQVTDRYAKAIALLASDNKLAERIGGIYALEHLLRESPVDHATIVDVLAAYVRDRAPAPADAESPAEPPAEATPAAAPQPQEKKQPAADVQAALTVLARRPPRTETTPLDLRATDLRGAELQKARFDHARLDSTNLGGAVLTGAQLQGAHLGGAQLQGAHLFDAQLQDAHLFDAQLQAAHLGGAQLQGADLIQAELQAAHLGGAQLQHAYLMQAQLQDAYLGSAQLQGAYLEQAQLQGAYLGGANLQGADLSDADLNDATLALADLRGAQLDEPEQLRSAHWGQLPPKLSEEYRSWLEPSQPRTTPAREGPVAQVEDAAPSGPPEEE